MKYTNFIDPIHALITEYNNFPYASSDKTTAQMLIKNICRIPAWTIEQTAAACNVSVSTLRRFIKGFGYKSYTEFRIKITEIIENYNFNSPPEISSKEPLSSNYLTRYTQKLTQDMEQFKKNLDPHKAQKIVEAMYHHEHIYIHDLLKAGMRLTLEKHLAFTGKTITFSHDTAQQYEDAAKGNPDSLYFLVYDGYTHSRAVIDTIPRVTKAGACVVVISSKKTFPEMEKCAYVLYIGEGSFTLSGMLLLDLTYQYLSELYKSLYISGRSLIAPT